MIRRTLASSTVNRVAGALAGQANQFRAAAGDPAADTRFAFGCLLCDRLAGEMLHQHGTPEARALDALRPFDVAPDVVESFVGTLGFDHHEQTARAVLAALATLVMERATPPTPEPAPAV